MEFYIGSCLKCYLYSLIFMKSYCTIIKIIREELKCNANCDLSERSILNYKSFVGPGYHHASGKTINKCNDYDYHKPQLKALKMPIYSVLI